MFSFLDYTHAIWKISEKKGVDLGVAFSMLKADIRMGHRFNTGDVVIDDLDLEAAHAAFKSLTEDEELAVYGERFDFQRRCYDAVCAVYPDKEKIAKVVAAYREGAYNGNNKA